MTASALLLLTYPTAALSQPSTPEEVYLQGKAAYERGDCETAIEKFEQFKSLVPERRTDNARFFRLLESKIAICRTRLFVETMNGDGFGGTGHSGGFRGDGLLAPD